LGLLIKRSHGEREGRVKSERESKGPRGVWKKKSPSKTT